MPEAFRPSHFEILVQLALAFALGLVLANLYRATHKGLSYSQSFTVTVVFDDGAYGNSNRDQRERFGGREIGTELRTHRIFSSMNPLNSPANCCSTSSSDSSRANSFSCSS